MKIMNPRIFGAFLVGGALMFGAYVLSGFGVSEAQLAVADPALGIVTGAAPVRSYISTQDQNSNGVPDWQEALRNTDPLILDELATSSYELPDTVTDEFAREFFERYVRSQGYGPAGVGQDEIVETSVTNLAAQAIPEFLTFDDITISTDNSEDAIFSYGNNVGSILTKYTSKTNESEAEILLDIVRSGDRSRMSELELIEQNYQAVIDDLTAVVVPSDLAKAHLDLTNSLITIQQDVEVFLQVYEDPMLAILHVQRYEDDVLGLGASLQNVIVEIVNTGVLYPTPSYPGFILMAFYPV